MSNPLRRGPKQPDSNGTVEPESQPPPPPTPTAESLNRTGEILTISVIVAILVLLGIGLMLWAMQYREYQAVLAPTPIPTATSAPAPTMTPDFRATRFAENMLTQEATAVSARPTAAAVTPGPATTARPTTVINLPKISGESGPPVATPGPSDTPAGSHIALPIISSGGKQTPTQSPTHLATATTHTIALPLVSNYRVTPTPILVEIATSQATAAPTLVEIATSQAVATPTAAPPTSTPIPSPTPIPYYVDHLKAFIRPQNTDVRIGPGNIYTVTGTIDVNTEVELWGRSPTGEWVYACCLEIEDGDEVDFERFWIRQAYAPPSDNELSAGAPEDANPNDVRWLDIQSVRLDLLPLPTRTPIPEGDYPLYRYTPDGRARLSDLPSPPLSPGWSNPAQAAQALSSPAVISGPSILVASVDNHLYSFDRVNGNQRWRQDIGEPVRVAPAVQDNETYVATESGRIFAFDEFGTELWNTDLVADSVNFRPVTGFNVYSDTLFIGAVSTSQETDRRIIAIDRRDRDKVQSYPVAGNPVLYPTVGDQMIYLEHDGLRAIDVLNQDTKEEVWSRPIINLTAPPVYSSVGVTGLAELYVADGGNLIYSLDANTGRELWKFENEETVTGMALNDSTLFVSGNGYVKAITRELGKETWRTNVSGPVLGGPVVDDHQIMIVTDIGNIQFLNAGTGEVQGGSIIGASAVGPAAAGDSWIFVPAENGSLYALREGS